VGNKSKELVLKTEDACTVATGGDSEVGKAKLATYLPEEDVITVAEDTLTSEGRTAGNDAVMTGGVSEKEELTIALVTVSVLVISMVD
jgi:hypothetical protein